MEALGAGADHAKTKAEKEEQITRDVSRTSFKISDRSFGCAMGEQIDVNIKEKMVSNSVHLPELARREEGGTRRGRGGQGGGEGGTRRGEGGTTT